MSRAFIQSSSVACYAFDHQRAQRKRQQEDLNDEFVAVNSMIWQVVSCGELKGSGAAGESKLNVMAVATVSLLISVVFL